MNFNVKFPPQEQADHRNIPDTAIRHVCRILRGHLALAATLLADLHTQWWRTKTFYPEHGSEHDGWLDEGSQYLFWFRSVLDRLIELDPDFVRHDCALWPEDECLFFDKLRLYVWSIRSLFEGQVVARCSLGLSDDVFWDVYTRRELLMMLKERWDDFSDDQRASIENRIAEGFSVIQGDDRKDAERRRSVDSACILGWLELEHCALTDPTRRRLEELRRVDPRWNPSWDEQAASSHEGGGGLVRTDPNPECLFDVPLNQIARDNTKEHLAELVHYRPFDGLVSQRPLKAVAALTHATRHNDFPLGFWRSVIQNWPADAPMRLVRLFAERLARLPHGVVFDLRFDLFRWAEKHLRIIARSEVEGAWRLFDTLLEKLLVNQPDSTKSSMGDTFVNRANDKRSRRTLEHAINSPVGDATQLLLEVLDDLDLQKGTGIPPAIRIRLERLVAVRGEGSDHAVCLVTRRINWLDHVDSVWIKDVVMPWFSLDGQKAEPAWNGFAYAGDFPRRELFEQIKPAFLAVVAHASQWHWREQETRRLHELLVTGCRLRRNDEPYVSFSEARVVLRATDEQGRIHCLFVLTFMVNEVRLWRRFVKPFLDQAWPRELEYQTELATGQRHLSGLTFCWKRWSMRTRRFGTIRNGCDSIGS